MDVSGAQQRLQGALQTKRSLLFYTLTATVPLIVITLVLLFTQLHGTWMMLLSVLGLITGLTGLGRLLFELTLDVAGYPDYKLPIWSVFYLIVYLISGFAFLFYARHSGAPGRYIQGFASNPREGYLDSLYLSLCNYIGSSPDSSIRLTSQVARFLSVGQGVLSMFINVVIITKFVNSF